MSTSPNAGSSRPAAAAERDQAEPEKLEVEPLPYDGVASVTVGTILWFIALIVMIPFADDLEADGRLWWIATAAVGFGLGLLGIWIVVRRRNRLRAAAAAADAARATSAADSPR